MGRKAWRDGLVAVRIVAARLRRLLSSAHRPAGGLLDESAGLALPADLHLTIADEYRNRGRERRRLFPPGGVVVDDALLELQPCLGEITPRPVAGGSAAQSVKDGHAVCWSPHGAWSLTAACDMGHPAGPAALEALTTACYNNTLKLTRAVK